MNYIPETSLVNLHADVPISRNRQIYFSSPSAQTLYFNNKRIATKAGCTYLKKRGVLSIEWNASVVQQANYLSFINPDFENVTFYCKILGYKYINNVTSEIYVEIDWFQTRMHEAEYHACSIIREHTTEEDYQKAVANPWRRDIPELLTDEGLPVGESLEAIYNDGTLSGFSIVGNRFDLLTGFPLITDAYKALQVTMYLSPIRTAVELSDTQLNQFRTFLSYWSTLNGQTFEADSVDIDSMFSFIRDNFATSYAVLTMPLLSGTTTLDNLSKAVQILGELGITSCIIGLYVLPNWIASGADLTTHFQIPKLIGYDPKLNTYPFRYLRVKSPLDVKEYRLDLFDSLSKSADGLVGFALKSNSNGCPRMTLLPMGYKNDNEGPNYFERLEYAAFPQVGIATDAYQSFLNNVISNSMLSTTIEQRRANLQSASAQNLAAQVAPVSSAISGITNVGRDVALGASQLNNFGNKRGALGAASTAAESYMEFTQLQGAAAQSQANYLAQRDLSTDIEHYGSGQSAVYNNDKRAFVGYDYKPSGTSGYLPYELDVITFICELVTLNDDILQKYSDFLTVYGYKSLRTGVPHICDYIKNGTNAPHNVTFDGETFTYVQTENMHVTGLQANECAYIENLFNSGCRFLKGD